MELTIKNKEELTSWMNERKVLGHNMTSIKGKAPVGSTYSDGSIITRPVNVQWVDCTNGDIFNVDYLTSN